jgi:hypothetical protein
MSRLMTVLGILFLALGAAIAVVGFSRPGQMQVSGLTMDTAALLLLSGVMALGFGGIMDAMQKRGGKMVAAVEVPTVEATPAVLEAPVAAPEPAAPTVTESSEEQPSRIRFRGFGRKFGADTATTAAATTAALAEAPEAAKSSVDDTIDALEKAKQDIATALGGVERISTTTPTPPIMASEPVAEAAVEEAAGPDEGELYVVEEKIIRGRPARILSDETVEAETDEGWMRFENIEHLNEYLDAAEA